MYTPRKADRTVRDGCRVNSREPELRHKSSWGHKNLISWTSPIWVSSSTFEEFKKQVTRLQRYFAPLPTRDGNSWREAIQQSSSSNRAASASPSGHGSGLSLHVKPSGVSTSLVRCRTLSSEHMGHCHHQGSCDNS